LTGHYILTNLKDILENYCRKSTSPVGSWTWKSTSPSRNQVATCQRVTAYFESCNR